MESSNNKNILSQQWYVQSREKARYELADFVLEEVLNSESSTEAKIFSEVLGEKLLRQPVEASALLKTQISQADQISSEQKERVLKKVDSWAQNLSAMAGHELRQARAARRYAEKIYYLLFNKEPTLARGVLAGFSSEEMREAQRKNAEDQEKNRKMLEELANREEIEISSLMELIDTEKKKLLAERLRKYIGRKSADEQLSSFPNNLRVLVRQGLSSMGIRTYSRRDDLLEKRIDGLDSDPQVKGIVEFLSLYLDKYYRRKDGEEKNKERLQKAGTFDRRSDDHKIKLSELEKEAEKKLNEKLLALPESSAELLADVLEQLPPQELALLYFKPYQKLLKSNPQRAFSLFKTIPLGYHYNGMFKPSYELFSQKYQQEMLDFLKGMSPRVLCSETVGAAIENLLNDESTRSAVVEVFVEMPEGMLQETDLNGFLDALYRQSQKDYLSFLKRRGFSTNYLLSFQMSKLSDLVNENEAVIEIFEESDRTMAEVLLKRKKLSLQVQQECRDIMFNKEGQSDEDYYQQFSSDGRLAQILPHWQRRIAQGVEQHRTHAFTLDVHTAKVIQKVQDFDFFSELPEKDQEILLWVALFHDIGKESGVVDDGHFEKSEQELSVLSSQLDLNHLQQRKMQAILKTKEAIDQYIENGVENMMESELKKLAWLTQTQSIWQMSSELLKADSLSVTDDKKWWNENRQQQLDKLADAVEPYITMLEETWLPIMNTADYLPQLEERIKTQYTVEDQDSSVEMLVFPSHLPEMFIHNVARGGLQKFHTTRHFIGKEGQRLCVTLGKDRVFRNHNNTNKETVELVCSGEASVWAPYDINTFLPNAMEYAFIGGVDDYTRSFFEEHPRSVGQTEVRQKVSEQAQKLIEQTWGDVLGQKDKTYLDLNRAFRHYLETYDPLSDRGEFPVWLKDDVTRQHEFRSLISLVQKLIRELPTYHGVQGENYLGIGSPYIESSASARSREVFTAENLPEAIEGLSTRMSKGGGTSSETSLAPQVFEANRQWGNTEHDEEVARIGNNEIILDDAKPVGVKADYPPTALQIKAARDLNVPLIVGLKEGDLKKKKE